MNDRLPAVLPTFLFVAACATTPSTPSPETTSAHESTIEAKHLQAHVEILASDEFEGRGAGYRGEKKAAEYIARKFQEAGLRPYRPDLSGPEGFFQPFEMHTLGGPVPWQKLQSQNVVGLLPGESAPSEIIVFGGHYDGQGRAGQAELGRTVPEDASASSATKDTIWNSAVDNAVSIAALIEIAERMSGAPAPHRTIAFVAFGAEESALDGSTHYANHPVGGRDSTRAMVNIEKLVGDPDAEFLYVSYGTSPVFPPITEAVAGETGLSLTPFYPGVIANTDHYPFILSGVPAVTIGTGSAERVHTALDHAEGLDYHLLAQHADFVSRYVARLAAAENTFEFTEELVNQLGASGGPATLEERRARSFDGPVAFKVATVVHGSPSHQVGLKPGDLVTAVDGREVPAQEYYQGLEDLLTPEQLCQGAVLTVQREGGTQTLPIQGGC